MNGGLLAGFVAALVAFALTPLFRHIGRRLGWTDTPNERSSHRAPTPRNGGKAIMMGIAAGLVTAEAYRDLTILTVVIVTGVLSLLGAIDDAKDLRWSLKLAVQLVATVTILSIPAFRMHFALALVAAFWIIGVTNGFNFMDGVNGIASAEATVCGLTMGALLLAAGDRSGAAVSFAVAGAAFGFFIWNGATGSIFMGDVGSLPLGFLLSVLVLRGATVGIAPWVMALPLLPFLLDTGITLLRRTVRREVIFRAHRTHYYQRLTDLGWSHLSVTMLWVALAAAAAAVSLRWNVLHGFRFVLYGIVIAVNLAVITVIELRHRALGAIATDSSSNAVVRVESRSTAASSAEDRTGRRSKD